MRGVHVTAGGGDFFHVEIAVSEECLGAGEAGVLQNLQRKSAQADKMFDRLVEHMNESITLQRNQETKTQIEIPSWISSQ